MDTNAAGERRSPRALTGAILQRTHTGPAFEGAIECTDLRIAEKEGDVRKAMFGAAQIFDTHPAANVSQKILEDDSVLFQTPFKRA